MTPIATKRFSHIYRYAVENEIIYDAMMFPRSTQKHYLLQIQMRICYRTHILAVNWRCHLNRTKYSWHRTQDVFIIRAKYNMDQLVWYDQNWPSSLVRILNSSMAKINHRHILHGIMYATNWTIDGSTISNWHREEKNCRLSVDGDIANVGYFRFKFNGNTYYLYFGNRFTSNGIRIENKK